MHALLNRFFRWLAAVAGDLADNLEPVELWRIIAFYPGGDRYGERSFVCVHSGYEYVSAELDRIHGAGGTASVETITVPFYRTERIPAACWAE